MLLSDICDLIVVVLCNIIVTSYVSRTVSFLVVRHDLLGTFAWDLHKI